MLSTFFGFKSAIYSYNMVIQKKVIKQREPQFFIFVLLEQNAVNKYNSCYSNKDWMAFWIFMRASIHVPRQGANLHCLQLSRTYAYQVSIQRLLICCRRFFSLCHRRVDVCTSGVGIPWVFSIRTSEFVCVLQYCVCVCERMCVCKYNSVIHVVCDICV